MLDDFAEMISKRLVDSSLSRTSRWANHKVYLPKPYEGYMSYEKFPWIREILDIKEGFVTVKKASQMGLSIAAIAKALHLVCEDGEDVAYILPTAALVSDFSKGRLQPILDMSPDLRDVWQEANVGFRQTADHKSMYIRGSQSEAGLVSIPLGRAIIDEFDRCNVRTLSMIEKRFSAREDFYLFSLSTPTLPDFGIDSRYEEGTQEQFMFKCPGCSKTITLRWPESVEVCGMHYADEDCSRSYYKCDECGHRLEHEAKPDWLAGAKWIASQKVPYHRSFHINQLFSPGMTAERVVREFLKGEISETARVEFTNQTLGEPYIREGARITPGILQDCTKGFSVKDERPRYADRMITMGVDTGSFLDCTINEYIYTGDPGVEPHLNSVAKNVFHVRIPGSDWGGLDRLMAEWQVQHCCIDFQPETQKAKEFARRFPGHVSLVQYRKGTTGCEIKSAHDENRVETLTVDRTGMMDIALGRFHEGRAELAQDANPTFKEHLQAPVRTYEINSEGRPVAVYVASTDDHYAHSFTYAEVAHFRAYNKRTGRAIKPGETVHNF